MFNDEPYLVAKRALPMTHVQSRKPMGTIVKVNRCKHSHNQHKFERLFSYEVLLIM